jgi:hypothetical protein
MKKFLVLAALLGAAFVAVPHSAKADPWRGRGGFGGGGGYYGGGHGHHHDCGPYGGFRQPRLRGGYYGGVPYGTLNPYGYNYYNAYGPGLYPRQGVQIYTPGLHFGYYR